MSAKFHLLPYHCKHCKRQGMARAAWDCPQEWIDKLFPALTCNQCFDAHQQEFRAVDSISRLCAILVRRPVNQLERNEIRQGLIEATRLFTSAVATLGNHEQVWQIDLVDLLMEHRDEWGRVLFNYRKGLHADIIKAMNI